MSIEKFDAVYIGCVELPHGYQPGLESVMYAMPLLEVPARRDLVSMQLGAADVLVSEDLALSMIHENKKAIAFFRAPGDVQTLECAGDRIAVGCKNEEVLHLQAPWLLETA